MSMAPPAEQQARRQKLANASDPMAVGAMSSFADWQRQNLQRLAFRAQWQAYFDDVDVFLSPVAFATAFPHDHSEPQSQRTIATAGGPRKYMDFLNWIAPATLTGCPATIRLSAEPKRDCPWEFKSWGRIGKTPRRSRLPSCWLARWVGSRRRRDTASSSASRSAAHTIP